MEGLEETENKEENRKDPVKKYLVLEENNMGKTIIENYSNIETF